VSVGLAASLARPGGMVTGLVNLSVDIVEKRTELLHDIVPKVERIGYLRDPNATSNPASIESVKRASSRLKLQALFAEAAHAEDLADAFSRLKNSGAQALVLLPSGWFTAERDRIAKLALEYRWPLIGGGTMADAGGLASYSADRAYNYRRAAWYVDQILKGRKPGDLPIEQPSKFELAANLKTAKALGITIPPVVMVRVDRVIK
jgi:putative ABC transport system substrate-binding protein